MLADLPYPPKMAILDIPTLRAHIWQTKCWQIYPPLHETLIIDSYSESSYLTDQMLADLPYPPKMAILDIPTLRAHIWETKCWQIYPPLHETLIIDSFSESSYLADQVLADLPYPPKMAIL